MSTDLVHWTALGDALPNLPSWATPDETWAPAGPPDRRHLRPLLRRPGGRPGGGDECLSVATATQPQGPFIDTSTGPLECQTHARRLHRPVAVRRPRRDALPGVEVERRGRGLGDLVRAARRRRDRIRPRHGPDPAPGARTRRGRRASSRRPTWWSAGGGTSSSTRATTGRAPTTPSGWPPVPGRSVPVPSPCPHPSWPATRAWRARAASRCSPTTSGATWIAFDAWAPDAVGYPNSRSLYIRPISLTGPTPVVGSPG